MKTRGLLVPIAVLALAACNNAAAQHHAMASQVLQRAQSASLSDVSTADYAAIRHDPSGLVCVLPVDGAFDLEEFPPEARNEGVYCSSVVDGLAETFVAVRYGDTVTLDQAFAEALSQALAPANPRALDNGPDPADDASAQNSPDIRIARLQGSVDGQQRYLRLAMTARNGWFLQQIVSAPFDRADAAEQTTSESWLRVVAGLAANEQHSQE